MHGPFRLSFWPPGHNAAKLQPACSDMTFDNYCTLSREAARKMYYRLTVFATVLYFENFHKIVCYDFMAH